MMRSEYKKVYRGGSAEIEEKKSRFIATVRPVKSEEEALVFLDEMKKTFWDARHNCYAFIIGSNKDKIRCSDDGEPSQTAGRPILSVLEGEGLTDVCAVVTRYFGGTLLGTGGLVRAYSAAARKGLESSVILTAEPGFQFEVETDYNGAGKLKHLFEGKGIPVLNTEYTERVVFTALFPEAEREGLMARMDELTNGRAVICGMKEVFYGLLGEKAVLL